MAETDRDDVWAREASWTLKARQHDGECGPEQEKSESREAVRETTRDHPLRALQAYPRSRTESSGEDPLSRPKLSKPTSATSVISNRGLTVTANSGTTSRSMPNGSSPSSQSFLWRRLLEKCARELAPLGNVRLRGGHLMPTSLSSPNDRGHDPRKAAVSLSKARLRLDHLQSKSRILETEQRRAPASVPGLFSEDGFVSLTKKECIDRIVKLRALLRRAWRRGERTQALRIIIHATKLLSDFSAPQQHPFLWAHVVEVLDEFGELVLNRLRRLQSKDSDHEGGRPQNVVAGQLSSLDACRHWFAKAANIRELLPRLYVQIALLPCYDLQHERDPSGEEKNDPSLFEFLHHIRKSIRGIGSPLAGLYCRAYFVRNGDVLFANRTTCKHRETWRDIVLASLFDYMQCSEDFRERQGAKVWTFHGMNAASFEAVHAPAAEWVVRTFGRDAEERHFDLAFERCIAAWGIGLRALLAGFAPHIFVPRAQALLDLIETRDWDERTRGGVLARIMDGLCAFQKVPQGAISTGGTSSSVTINNIAATNNNKLALFARLRLEVSQLQEMETFADCAVALVELAQAQGQEGEDYTETVRGVMQRLRQDFDVHGTLERVEPQMERLCMLFCGDETEPSNACLADENVMETLEMIQSARKTSLEKILLARLAPTSDPVVIHTALTVARDLHDAIDALAGDAERRHTGQLVCHFLDCIELARARDRDQLFQILGDCRASFPNLECALERIVHRVAQLALCAGRARGAILSRPKAREEPFVKSCLAFCHITIPSLESPARRFALSLHCARVALARGVLPQMDAHLEQALGVWNEITPDESRLECVRAFLGGIAGVPTMLEEPLYFVRKVCDNLHLGSWDASLGARGLARVAVVQVLVALGQDGGLSRGTIGELMGKILSDVYHEDLAPLRQACAGARPAEAEVLHAFGRLVWTLLDVLTSHFALEDEQRKALARLLSELQDNVHAAGPRLERLRAMLVV